MKLPYETLDAALKLLDGRLTLNGSKECGLVVCGGTALNALDLVQRTTQDVDIVALMDNARELADPAPLPLELLAAANEVELLQALQWTTTHDPSDGFRLAIKLFLDGFG